MRIAFDIAALDRGGAERQVLEVASGLHQRDHDVLMVVNKAAKFPEYAGRLPITELHYNGRYDLRVVAGVRRTLRAFCPDVCVCVSFNASLWGRLAAASLGCRVVVAEHSTRAVPSRSVRLTNTALRGVTESVIACAEAQIESLLREGHQRAKITVVRNGVDAERFTRDDAGAAKVRQELQIPSKALALGLVAAHRPEKRHDRFIALLERLDDAGIEAWGVMVGGGPLVSHTVSLARASRVAERLRVTGPRSDMPAVYSAADVVVLVSDDVETFPLCFLEAQACRVPVVGPDIGGVCETMIPGTTGFVVGRDDLAGMVEVVAALLADRDRRRAMGAAGRELVSHELSRDAMIDGYERVLA